MDGRIGGEENRCFDSPTRNPIAAPTSVPTGPNVHAVKPPIVVKEKSVNALFALLWVLAWTSLVHRNKYL